MERGWKAETSKQDLTSIWQLHEMKREADFGTLLWALQCCYGYNK